MRRDRVRQRKCDGGCDERIGREHHRATCDRGGENERSSVCVLSEYEQDDLHTSVRGEKERWTRQEGSRGGV